MGVNRLLPWQRADAPPPPRDSAPGPRLDAQRARQARLRLLRDRDVEGDAARRRLRRGVRLRVAAADATERARHGIEARLAGVDVLVAVLDAPAAERSLVGEGLHQDQLAQDVAALVMAIHEQEAVHLVVGHQHLEVEGEAHRVRRLHALFRIEEHGEQVRALAAVGRALRAGLAGEQVVVGAEHRGVFAHFAARHLPLATAHGDRDLELVRRAHGLALVEGFLHLDGQRDVVDVKDAVHAQPAEQEAREVLVALLGVHDAVVARVAAVHEGARRAHVLPVGARPVRGRVVDAYEAVAGLAGAPRRKAAQRRVVARVGADEVEDALGREVLHDRDVVALGQAEVAGHLLAVEVVHVAEGEPGRHVAHDAHVDAVVRRGVGEELVHRAARLR